MNPAIVTRFAPSPTGYLHVGGARTALFNYLFARQQGGLFRLRIEDTDRERSSEEMTRQIFDSLEWLGLEWDGEVVFQGARADIHRQVAYRLLEEGKAFRCFCTREEIERKRQEAQKRKETYRYDGTCRRLSPEQIQEKLKAGLPYSLRFIVPEGITSWEDEVYGHIEVPNAEYGDFIIVRSDGSPVYLLAVVVDDHEMGITHVIRGADHISNTARQIMLYRALGWSVPRFAHLPLILGPDKRRLSKRHGATSVDEFRRMGVLPEALFNYLALLGWSPGDDREIFSKEELIQAFSLQRISKQNAVFDEKKLFWINSEYISARSAEELFPEVTRRWVEAGYITEKEVPLRRGYLLRVIELLKSRMHVLQEYVTYGIYYFRDPVQFDPKGVKKHLKDPQVWQRLELVLERLEKLKDFQQDAIEQEIRQLAEELGISAAKLIHPIRLAITGMSVSPGLFEVMEVLGKETVIRRLREFLNKKEQFSGE